MIGFLLRTYTARWTLEHWYSSLLLTAAVSLAVSVFLAVLESGQATVASFGRSSATLAGSEALEISSARGYLTSEELAAIGPQLAKDFHLSPVFELRTVGDLTLVGVDFASLSTWPDFMSEIGRRGAETGPVLYLSKASREALQTEADGRVTITLPRGKGFRAAVALVDLEKLPARTALVSLPLLQENEGDRVTSLLLRPKVGEADAEVARSLQSSLRPFSETFKAELYLESPASRRSQAQSLLAAFRFNIGIMVAMALFVCAFVIYNAAQISLEVRRRGLRLLRTLGASRLTLFVLILSEYAILGAIGALFGVSVGRIVTDTAAEQILRATSLLYGARAALPEDVNNLPSLETTAISVLAGVITAVVGALAAAYRASREPPAVTEQVTLDSITERPLRVVPRLAAALLLFGLTALLVDRALRAEAPALAHLASFVLILGLLAACVPMLIATVRVAERVVAVRRSVVTLLALARASSGIRLSSVAVGATAAGLSLLLGLTIMVDSFRASLEEWLTTTLKADLFIRPRTGIGYQRYLDPAVIDTLQREGSVRALYRFSALERSPLPEQVTVAGADIKVGIAEGAFAWEGRPPESALLEAGAVLLSENAARRLRMSRGDSLTLPQGKFLVAAVYKDFSNERGYVLFDLAHFQRLFSVDGVVSVSAYMNDRRSLDPIVEKLPGRGSLTINSRTTLRSTVLSIFDETFAITSLMKVVVVLIAATGFALTLLQLVVQRAPQLRIVTLLGVTPLQHAAALIIEAALLGIAALILSCAVGTALAGMLLQVINPLSFGWTLRWHASWSHYLLPVAVIGVCLIFVLLVPLTAQLRFLRSNKAYEWRER